MKTTVLEIDPKDVLLLERNARFMRHETFQQLVKNIRKDGQLTQIPFGWLNRERGGYEVLSGNHRVKAAVEAGLETIRMQVTDDELTEDERTAIQLSHNAISGEDDPAMLKELYDGIGDIDFKLYAGLDDKTLELLASINPESIDEPGLRFANLSFVLLPTELKDLQAVWDRVKALISGSDAKWIGSYREYDAFLETLDTAGTSHGISNMASALHLVTALVEDHLDDLADGWMDRETDHGDWVPLSTVFGTNRIPAPLAKKLKQRIDQAKGAKEIERSWEALTAWSADGQ